MTKENKTQPVQVRPYGFFIKHACGFAVLMAAAQQSTYAADWSDTDIGWRYGTQFAEPYESNNITKNILNLTHVSGYKYGINFFNVDMLFANQQDPSAIGSMEGSQEVYIVYRNLLDLAKITGSTFKIGPVRDMGVTMGFDTNAKTDCCYNSKKRMVVAGPTLMMDVPGFLNISVLNLWESNAPSGWDFATNSTYSISRYYYKTHPELDIVWGIPIGSLPLEFNGYADLIASKGKDEFGNQTATETHIDMELMYDVMGGKTFKVGFEYEYWKNKFGNNTAIAGPGAFAKTPMIRAEYHF